MSYTVFNKKKDIDFTKEKMFFGETVNVSRYDKQKFIAFEESIESQLGYFWKPEEIDVSKDRRDFASLQENEKHIFLSNLKYQTLLDSIQGRSPNVAFLPIVSIPELETWIESWSFSETIHSRSYTHIMRNALPDPSSVLDDIVNDDAILARANDVSKHYDKLIELNAKRQLKTSDYNEYDHKVALFMAMVAVNALEAIRFYVSFACSFAFAENELMTGNAKIIKLIARDEALHLKATEFIINTWRRDKDDPIMHVIYNKYKDHASKIFHDAVVQEEQWADYLFSKGSMLGLNAEMLKQYIRYIAARRMLAIGIEPTFEYETTNPFPWMDRWLNSSKTQSTPQEAEITSYVVGGIDNSLDDDFLDDLEL